MFFLFFCAETVIPVCPPACGQAYYGYGVASMSNGVLIAVNIVIVMIIR